VAALGRCGEATRAANNNNNNKEDKSRNKRNHGNPTTTNKKYGLHEHTGVDHIRRTLDHKIKIESRTWRRASRP